MANGFTDAPASWNVRYITPDGFSCQLTIRDETGADLLPKTEAAIRWLLEHDCYPSGGYIGDHAPKGEPHQSQTNGRPDAAWCHVHQVAMKRRERDGSVWYSYTAPDRTWCKGR